MYILTCSACRPLCCSLCRLPVCGCFQPSCWILIELLRRQQTVSSDHRLNCIWTRIFKAAADSQIFYSFIQQMHRPSTFTCLSSSSAQEERSSSLLLLVVASSSSRVTAQPDRLLLVIISLKLIKQQLLVSLFIIYTLTAETQAHRFRFSPLQLRWTYPGWRRLGPEPLGPAAPGQFPAGAGGTDGPCPGPAVTGNIINHVHVTFTHRTADCPCVIRCFSLKKRL